MVAAPYAEGFLISYTAEHHQSKREKVEWYFCFCLKKQIPIITIQTNAGSGMYKHLHFQLKCQHFWACCPKQSGVWADTSSWIDFCTLRSKSASQKCHSSWPFGAEQTQNDTHLLFCSCVLLRGPRWEGTTQVQSSVESSGFTEYLSVGLEKSNFNAIDFQVIICMQDMFF